MRNILLRKILPFILTCSLIASLNISINIILDFLCEMDIIVLVVHHQTLGRFCMT